MIKGGIWKNAEDEVLKAAVMKYGLNQWSRISSLLVRKSAKECKARWYEWLDPSIKKTEWTREEEEKLLHLSKIFPCQWRTIAPILQRTPAQCVEHYEKLLDRVQGKEEPDENDPRRLRPGEIDPNPEAKPARPDEVDMDEDVKEMLQEARARLSNTRGKKAKRKAREKILDEARRLANLQKKRELKAAGIEFVIPKRQRGMDFNSEIPFERPVPIGRYSAGPEEEPHADRFRTAISVQQLEGKSRDEELKRQRMIDQRRMKKLKEKQMPVALSIINKMTEGGILFKRSLDLPEPQVSDRELQAIAKLASQSPGLPTQKSTKSDVTETLVGNYTPKEATPMVMRTPMLEDRVLREAQDALAIKNAETPLVGGITAEPRTPQLPNPTGSSAPRTPNTLLNRLESQQRESSVFRVPTKRPTTRTVEGKELPPLRDQLSTLH
jgi:pre-mRNA-splicing factor CDC5/CEF1